MTRDTNPTPAGMFRDLVRALLFDLDPRPVDSIRRLKDIKFPAGLSQSGTRTTVGIPDSIKTVLS